MSCFLGSHRREDLNESAGGKNVMFIYPDRQHYGSFLARPKNGYLEYDSSSSNKEELKKTILKHESIFKQQLEELHRLYRRQMDLMNGIKKRRRQQQQQQKQHFPSQRRSLLFSQFPFDDDFSRKSNISAISFVGSRNQNQMDISTMLNFHDMKIIIPGKALNLEIPADVEVKMQNERSSSYNGFTKPESFLKRTSCELFDLNQPFQEAVADPGNSTNLFKSLLVEPSKTNMVGSEQVQKSRIFGVDISKGNYEDHTHKGNNSESTSFSNIDQSQKSSTKNLSITNTLGLRHDHIDLNLGVDELADDFHVPCLKPDEIVELEKDPECKLTEEDEEHVRTAAEAIVHISSVVDDQILTSPPCKTLDWFAEIACYNHGHGYSTFDEEIETINPPSGMDYFEFMTLNLTEMKSDEWCLYKKPVLDNHEMNGKEEEGLGSRLRKSRRRGRGRQRKDFQRDVLPGIVSLSRYEVSEDILAFEELLKTDRRKPQSNVVDERRREEMTSLLLLLLPEWGRRTKRISRLKCLASTTSKS